MSVTRRQVLGGAALVGAAGALGVARMGKSFRPDVLVYDSAQSGSAAFASATAAPHRIDLRGEAAIHWRGLRRLTRGTRVAGLTNWELYVAARGCLEEQGLRMISETVRRPSGLVAWTMA